MKLHTAVGYGLLAAIASSVFGTANADNEKTTRYSYVDLTGTDLQTKRNLLDCELQLKKHHSGYRLHYRDSEVDVPKNAVRQHSDQYVFIAIKGNVGGIPATGLWIRTGSQEQQFVTCRRENTGCSAPVAYILRLQKDESSAYKKLSSLYPQAQIVAGATNRNGEVNPGAIMITDRPELHSPSMDGLSGSDNKRITNLHFVCGTTVKHFEQTN